MIWLSALLQQLPYLKGNAVVTVHSRHSSSSRFQLRCNDLRMRVLLVQLSTVAFFTSLVINTQASSIRGFTLKERSPHTSPERSEATTIAKSRSPHTSSEVAKETTIAGNGTDLASGPTPGGHVGHSKASAGTAPGKRGRPAAARIPGGDRPRATPSYSPHPPPPPPPPHPVPAPPSAAPPNPYLPGGPVVQRPPMDKKVDLSSSDQRKSSHYPTAFSVVVVAAMVLVLLLHR